MEAFAPYYRTDVPRRMKNIFFWNILFFAGRFRCHLNALHIAVIEIRLKYVPNGRKILKQVVLKLKIFSHVSEPRAAIKFGREYGIEAVHFALAQIEHKSIKEPFSTC